MCVSVCLCVYDEQLYLCSFLKHQTLRLSLIATLKLRLDFRAAGKMTEGQEQMFPS